MKVRRTTGSDPELRVPGLTDRSERPTTHALFAPMEREKQREEKALRKKLGRSRGNRKPSR